MLIFDNQQTEVSKKKSLKIGIHVFAKLGKQFCVDSTCLNVVDDPYDCCKPIFYGNQ